MIPIYIANEAETRESMIGTDGDDFITNSVTVLCYFLHEDRTKEVVFNEKYKNKARAAMRAATFASTGVINTPFRFETLEKVKEFLKQMK